MSDRQRRWVPVGVGLFGLVLGIVSGSFPTHTLLQMLVLAQSSLLAIVVSVSLLSVQSSPFAPVLSSLDRESAFEPIFGTFGLSILADVTLLSIPATRSGPLGGLVLGTSLGLAAWFFVSLFDVETHLAAFLNPEPVLSDLVEGISYERYREFAERHSESGSLTRNPLLEIVQVAQTSLDQRDNFGALQAVTTLEAATICIVEDYNTSGSDGRDPLSELFDYWNQLARTAVGRGADDVLYHIVEAQTAVAKRAIELGLPEVCDSATASLELFCELAIREGRVKADDVAALGEVLLAAVEADDLVLVDAVTDHLESLCEYVETVPGFDEVVLEAVAVALLGAQARLVASYPGTIAEERHARVYAHLESAADRCVGDLLVTGATVDAVGEAFRDVAVAAADADHQWIVRRIATRIVDLDAAADDRYPGADDHVQAIHDAGGEDGVETAFDYVREVYGDGQPVPFDDPVSRLDG